MLRTAVAMLAGGWSLNALKVLPPDALLVLLSAVALGGLCWRPTRVPALFLLGAVWAWVGAREALGDRLAPELAAEAHSVALRILDFPRARGQALRFIAEPVGAPELPRRIRLTWYDTDASPQIGEVWALRVRLRPPRGYANPGSFDYELWLLRQRIGATGYVVADTGNRHLTEYRPGRRALRRREVVERLEALGLNREATAVLMAITAGARHRIGPEQWERFAASGTSHLMAISGLHIGLAAASAWLLARLLLAALCRNANLRDLAAGAGLAAACCYAEISGYGIPARRALLMLFLALIAIVLRRPPAVGEILGNAALAVFIADPLALHDPGFKLSFGAVALLLWLTRQRDVAMPAGGFYRQAARAAGRLASLQLRLLLGLLPLTALMFGRVPWLAPAVNLAVLPIFNFVTVPFALAGLVCAGPFAPLGDLLLRLAGASVQLVLGLVTAAADWPPARTTVAAPTGFALALFLLPAVWAFAPPGFPGRRLALAAVAAVIAWRPAGPPPGCLDLTALDVGQGLALHLRTHRRSLLYDTGPSFHGGGDAARVAILPYFAGEGIDRIDMLVVSHGDQDHAGGAGTLVGALSVEEVLTGDYLPGLRRRQLACRRGQAWVWDGVLFAVAHPGDYPVTSRNNGSCVLEVSAGEERILLTGDIGEGVENHLVRSGAVQPASVLVVGHHGSTTSSGKALVAASRPKVAVVSAGYGNRWGFPRPAVTERWRDAGAAVVNTATEGALRFRMCPDTGLRELWRQRRRADAYWRPPPEE